MGGSVVQETYQAGIRLFLHKIEDQKIMGEILGAELQGRGRKWESMTLELHAHSKVYMKLDRQTSNLQGLSKCSIKELFLRNSLSIIF